MKKWIIFDAMGVIFKVGDDTNTLLVPFVQEHNKTITREDINEIYREASLGKITSREFWKKMNIIPNSSECDMCREYLDSYLTLDENFIEVAKQLKDDYTLGMLSNDVSEWSIYLRKIYGLDDLLEFAIIRGDVGCRKPRPEIYQIAMNQVGAEAGDCIFIDDRDKNLIPAMELGMHTIKFSRNGECTHLKNVPVITDFFELKEIVNNIFAVD